LEGSSFGRGFSPAVVETVFVGNGFQSGKIRFMRFIVNEGHSGSVLNKTFGSGRIWKTLRDINDIPVG